MSKLVNLFSRYIIILFAGLGNLFIFYKIFTPLTTKLSAFILNIFTTITLISNTIILPSKTIQIIPACVAGSAYYLLFILNLATPEIKINKRIKIILFSFSSLLILNVARILILSQITNQNLFNILHLVFWYLLSTIFVVAIWFISVKLFQIKEIPFYSDIKFILKYKRHSRKKSKRSK